jgi:hypothetical protein
MPPYYARFWLIKGELLNTQNWLPLMEYSAKFRVSLSTLRRRIKAGEIEYKFADGKYLLRDGPLQVVFSGSETIAPPSSVISQIPNLRTEPEHDQFWQTTQGLLNEIKKAYSLILQEKEEQILQLKEEVADLKTLVRVLEDENNRVKNLQPKLDFDLGLEI